MKKLLLLSTLVALTACGQKSDDAPAAAPPVAKETMTLERTPSAESATLYFVAPMDGDNVTSPVTVNFGLDGMAVVKAGVDEMHSGHHHLIVDAELPPLDMPIPATENYIHFGDASTSTTIELPPGEHTLQLLLGDHRHVPHDPPVLSEVITITVLEPGE